MLMQVQSTRPSRLPNLTSETFAPTREQAAMPDAETPTVGRADGEDGKRAPVPPGARVRVDGLNTADSHAPGLGRYEEVRAFAAGLATVGVVDQTRREDFAALASRLRVSGTRDVNDLVQQVLREAYLETTQDLSFYAQKVAFYNDLKKKIRADITALRKALSDNAGAPNDAANTAKPIKFPLDDIDTDAFVTQPSGERVPNPQFGLPRYPGAAEAVSRWASIPELDAAGTMIATREDEPDLDIWPTKEELNNAIEDRESQLNSVGDDAQLANVDLQNILQKQQQTLQMMSNISKVLHDTAMAVARKISG